MSVSLIPCYHVSTPGATAQAYGYRNPHKPSSRWREKWGVIRCSSGRGTESGREEKNYYELLGVSVGANVQEIKAAYRTLQKKYHPDVAGQQGHEYTLMLNKAYKALIREDLRKDYDVSIGQTRVQFGRNASGVGYSSWKGPLRQQALFVDEHTCIGCRECIHHAGNTFVMDETMGCARVKVQFADSDEKLEVSVESCPVNCIYWVDREELAVLEFLIQPQPKKGYGVFGGGWERPANVFMAAKAFSKQLKQEAEAENKHRKAKSTVEEETPAQTEARVNASKEIKMERLSIFRNFFKQVFHWIL